MDRQIEDRIKRMVGDDPRYVALQEMLAEIVLKTPHLNDEDACIRFKAVKRAVLGKPVKKQKMAKGRIEADLYAASDLVERLGLSEWSACEEIARNTILGATYKLPYQRYDQATNAMQINFDKLPENLSDSDDTRIKSRTTTLYRNIKGRSKDFAKKYFAYQLEQEFRLQSHAGDGEIWLGGDEFTHQKNEIQEVADMISVWRRKYSTWLTN